MALTCMMRFHSLERMYKQTAACKVDFAGLCYECALYLASWPENVPHTAPGRVWLGTKLACAIFSHLEARRSLSQRKIHNGVFVDH